MLQYDELRLTLNGSKAGIDDLAVGLGLEKLKAKIKEYETQSAEAEFWNDLQNSQKVLQELQQLKNKVAKYESLVNEYEEALAFIDIANEEEDLDLLPEAQDNVKKVLDEYESQRLTTLLSGQYDANNAILTFHAGAGGTEAMDWAEMLFRMYRCWSESHGYKFSVLDYLEGEEAGLKSASVMIEGLNAYGYMRSENGVHRLVRVSPFDASGRRHTSFASLEVMPEISDDIEIEIKEEDLKVDTYRSSGAGGQHVNKTESAIRITHIPTGIVVACQNERSQHQNREVAMRMLKSKLLEIKEREHLEHIDDIKGVQKDIAWGSQIRSYVFMPYQLVKDHRTGFENGNIQAVMDGELDGFINAYLKCANLGTLQQ